MMRQGAALTVGLGLAVAPVALAAKPPKPPKGSYAVSIGAAPTTVVFGRATQLSGFLAGPTVAGVTVRLEQDTTLPLGDKFTPTGMTTTTAANGAYSFAGVKPGVNSDYRAVAQTSPSTTSPVQLVNVRPLVGFKLSTSTPRRGARVRFSGSVLPAHNGLTVAIQRRSSTGSWVTVARSTLVAAGTTQSTYSKRLVIRRNGVFRVKLPAHADHVTGYSRTRSIVVH
jgi:hypothetical protein